MKAGIKNLTKYSYNDNSNNRRFNLKLLYSKEDEENAIRMSKNNLKQLENNKLPNMISSLMSGIPNNNNLKHKENEKENLLTKNAFDYLKIKEETKSKQTEKNNQFFKNLVNLPKLNSQNDKLLSYVSNLDQLKLEDYNNSKRLQESLLYNINQKVGIIKKELDSYIKRDLYYKELNDMYNYKIQNEQNNTTLNIQSYKGSTYEERNCNSIN